jgi:hypothetical protein
LHGGAAERRALEVEPGPKLWPVFWLGGTALAVLSFALHRAAEHAFLAGSSGIAALLDGSRLVLFLAWFFVCWKNATNVAHRRWTYAARVALLIALVGAAILY